MADRVDLTQAAPILQGMIAVIVDNSAWLSQIDGAIGDGDHGVNMAKGFTQAGAALGDAARGLAPAFNTLGDTLLSGIGGSMGPLHGTFFLDMAASLGDAATLDAALFSRMVRAGLAGVIDLGAAQVGDKDAAGFAGAGGGCVRRGGGRRRRFRCGAGCDECSGGEGPQFDGRSGGEDRPLGAVGGTLARGAGRRRGELLPDPADDGGGAEGAGGLTGQLRSPVWVRDRVRPGGAGGRRKPSIWQSGRNSRRIAGTSASAAISRSISRNCNCEALHAEACTRRTSHAKPRGRRSGGGGRAGRGAAMRCRVVTSGAPAARRSAKRRARTAMRRSRPHSSNNRGPASNERGPCAASALHSSSMMPARRSGAEGGAGAAGNTNKLRT